MEGELYSQIGTAVGLYAREDLLSLRVAFFRGHEMEDEKHLRTNCRG